MNDHIECLLYYMIHYELDHIINDNYYSGTYTGQIPVFIQDGMQAGGSLPLYP